MHPLSCTQKMFQPIRAAAADGDTALLEQLELLEAGADVHAADGTGIQALHYAGIQGHPAALQLLLGRGAKMDAANSHGQQALHVAARNGDTAALQLLFDYGGCRRH